MQIPQDRIEQLKCLYKEAFGDDLSDEEAQVQGLAILRLVAFRLDSVPPDQKERIMNGIISV